MGLLKILWLYLRNNIYLRDKPLPISAPTIKHRFIKTPTKNPKILTQNGWILSRGKFTYKENTKK